MIKMEWSTIYAIQIGIICLIGTVRLTIRIVKDLRKGNKSAAVAKFQYWAFIIVLALVFVWITKSINK